MNFCVLGTPSVSESAYWFSDVNVPSIAQGHLSTGLCSLSVLQIMNVTVSLTALGSTGSPFYRTTFTVLLQIMFHSQHWVPQGHLSTGLRSLSVLPIMNAVVSLTALGSDHSLFALPLRASLLSLGLMHQRCVRRGSVSGLISAIVISPNTC